MWPENFSDGRQQRQYNAMPCKQKQNKQWQKHRTLFTHLHGHTWLHAHLGGRLPHQHTAAHGRHSHGSEAAWHHGSRRHAAAGHGAASWQRVLLHAGWQHARQLHVLQFLGDEVHGDGELFLVHLAVGVHVGKRPASTPIEIMRP